MAITYAGVETCLPTMEMARWAERFICMNDSRFFNVPPAITSTHSLRDRTGTKINLGQPNYPQPYPTRVNQLVWPTGAARYATCFLLATTTQKDEMLGLGASPAGAAIGNPSTLVMVDDEDADNWELSTEMYALRPHPLSSRMTVSDLVGGGETTEGQAAAVEQAAIEGMWLVPLVDVRYYWIHFRSTENLVLDTDDTWSDLFSDIGSAIGETITAEAAHAAYKKPDPVQFTRRYKNPALMLDAAAHSVGQRIVRELDGTVRSMGWGTAKNTLTSQFSDFGDWVLMAGDEYGDQDTECDHPAAVNVVFPAAIERHHCDGVHVVEVLYSEISGSLDDDPERIGVPNTAKVIHTTQFAAFTNCADLAPAPSPTASPVSPGASDASPQAGVPENILVLTDMAERIAIDYYDSIDKRYDYVFAGLKEWLPCAYDDVIIWSAGCLCPHPDEVDEIANPGGYHSYTRAISAAHNFDVEEMCHQHGNWIYVDHIDAKLVDALSTASGIKSPSYATASVYSGCQDGFDDLGFDVEITNRDCTLSAPAGSYAVLIWMAGPCEWRPAWLSCEPCP